jgi:hypothetical protein
MSRNCDVAPRKDVTAAESEPRWRIQTAKLNGSFEARWFELERDRGATPDGRRPSGPRVTHSGAFAASRWSQSS